MQATTFLRWAARGAVLAILASLAACGSAPKRSNNSNARECMARAMYFESNRSSDEGMLAVGTVVMNRVESDKFPHTVCGVVGQKNQFAPGVLSKPMKEEASRARAYRMADQVLGGKRHRGVGREVMFFHTAGYNFRYDNMNYKLIAGGNAFYEKRSARNGQRNTTQAEVAMRQGLAGPKARPDRVESAPVMVAAAPPAPRPAPVPALHASPPPAPVLAVVPVGPAVGSIEDLIMMDGG